MTEPRPQDGYPYEASYVADNDYALGRIVEFLSHTPWWREMAIFVTEDDAQGGRDHIDAHRTVFMGDRAVLQAQLRVAREHQFSGDAEDHLPAAGIAAAEPVRCGRQRFERLLYRARRITTATRWRKEDARLFDPAAAREPLDPRPRVKMDDPAEVVR